MDAGRVDTPTGFALPRSARVRGTKDIRRLFSRGERKRTAHLDVFFLASPVLRPRWGTVVPKHRHTLVERNLLRRRLRTIGRTEVLPVLWEVGRKLDVLVRARPEAFDATFEALRTELVRATEEICSDSSSSA